MLTKNLCIYNQHFTKKNVKNQEQKEISHSFIGDKMHLKCPLLIYRFSISFIV
jgi:hypothetical protein